MDKLIAMQVFITTVEKGSVSAAAEWLDMSRAMASRYLAEMEEWAGARLLHRTTRKLSLTSAGEALLPVCREMRQLSEQVERVVAEQDQEQPRGQLRVTTSGVLAYAYLTPVIVEYLKQYPLTAVDLQIIDRTVNLVEERIDVAIRITNNLDPNLIARKIGACNSILCASPEYLAKRGIPRHIEELPQHNCLTYAYFGQSLWEFIHQGEPVSIPVNGNFSANEAIVLQDATLAGAGIAMLPTFSARQHLKTGSLVQIMPDYQLPDMGIYAVYTSRKHMSLTLRTFIDFLIDYFSKEM